MDTDGKQLSKREVFERLYDEELDPQQTSLDLVAAGMHPGFSLEKRGDYDQIILKQQQIAEATREVITLRAVTVARRVKMPKAFDKSLKAMVEGMMDVYDNFGQIKQDISERVE